VGIELKRVLTLRVERRYLREKSWEKEDVGLPLTRSPFIIVVFAF
jgi:hypothetical protein